MNGAHTNLKMKGVIYWRPLAHLRSTCEFDKLSWSVYNLGLDFPHLPSPRSTETTEKQDLNAP